ncbi:MAG TPA: hypothetical protein VHV51_16995, partial [Polyangiaceae bacterium]|nr:hypothetical protein [Polyangiaceae bacterium]
LSPYLLPTPETRQAHDSNVRLHRVLGWGGVGLGAVITGASVVLIAANSSTKSTAQKNYDAALAQVSNPTPDSVCDTMSVNGDFMQCNANTADAKSKLDSANSKNLIGYIGIGVGVAVAATGIVFLVTGEDPHRFDAPKKSSASGPRWALAPGPGQFGLALGASF